MLVLLSPLCLPHTGPVPLAVHFPPGPWCPVAVLCVWFRKGEQFRCERMMKGKSSEPLEVESVTGHLL